jgi:hypothetical protein
MACWLALSYDKDTLLMMVISLLPSQEDLFGGMRSLTMWTKIPQSRLLRHKT